MTGTLDGRVVLVTGGGAGIGRAICRHAASAGATVVVAAPGDNGEQTARTIADSGGAATWIRTDVTSASDVKAAVSRTVEELGGLFAVVHNATSRHSSQAVPLTDLSLQEWDDHVAVSLDGGTALPAYGAVKGALRGFTKSLAQEWGPDGISVNCVSPLAMTPAMERAFVSNPVLEEGLRQTIPLRRIGDPFDDIAPSVTFLLSDGGSYISGQTFVVDGGRFTTL
jgi:3-oxoacyl-[acyl-carrier protein] reductase